jgi:hypothetical protein
MAFTPDQKKNGMGARGEKTYAVITKELTNVDFGGVKGKVSNKRGEGRLGGHGGRVPRGTVWITVGSGAVAVAAAAAVVAVRVAASAAAVAVAAAGTVAVTARAVAVTARAVAAVAARAVAVTT